MQVRMRLRHSDVAAVILAREITCSWGFQRGARQWRVEHVRGERNATSNELARSIVAIRGGEEAWFFTRTKGAKREGKDLDL